MTSPASQTWPCRFRGCEVETADYTYCPRHQEIIERQRALQSARNSKSRLLSTAERLQLAWAEERLLTLDGEQR